MGDQCTQAASPIKAQAPKETPESLGSATGSRNGRRLGGGSFSTRDKHHLDDAVLNLEYVTDSTAKVLLRISTFTILAATGLLLYQAVVKFTKDDFYLALRSEMQIVNTVVGSICLVVLLLPGCVFFWGTFQARHKYWSYRRRRTVVLHGLEIGIQIVNAALFLMPNALNLSHPCYWFSAKVHWAGWVQWTCWNSLATLWCIQAHDLFPLDGGKGFLNWALGMRWKGRIANKDASAEDRTLIIDLPFWIHTPKVLLMWLPTEVAATLFLIYLLGYFGGDVQPVELNDEDCSFVRSPYFLPYWEKDHLCGLEPIGIALSTIVTSFVMIQLMVIIALALVARRKLQELPYNKFRVSNMELRVLFRTKAVALVFMQICMAILWFAKLEICNSYVLTWFGLTPMQLVASVLVAIISVLYCPIAPSAKQLELHEWLQDLAWTEAEVPAKLWRRRAADKSLFCFESSIKALYWSWYIYNDARSLETGMRLYGLQQYLLLGDKQRDSKCIVAWGPGTILVVFRGTASMANVKSDIQAWRAVHPPARGQYLLSTQPLVHAGFLRSWEAGGLNTQVLTLLREILAGTASGSRLPEAAGGEAGDADASPVRGGLLAGRARRQDGFWRIICTGHSLGGAMATLAAYDAAQVVKDLEGVNADVTCITFGAPRPGNSAFARDFQEQVPNAWDVFNSNDAVAVEGKFLFLYKRAAHRVVLTPTRDIVVRPSHIEATMQRGPASSVTAHMLRNYARALTAILRAQYEKGALSEEQVAALRSVEEGVLKEIISWAPSQSQRSRKGEAGDDNSSVEKQSSQAVAGDEV